MATESLFPREIETDRLRLVSVAADPPDPLALYEHCREGAPHVDEITEFLTWSPHETPRVTAEFLEHAAEAHREGEAAHYVVRPRDGEDGTGEIAGMTGFEVDWDRRSAEFGIWLREPFWGRGYSGERAAALFEVVFDRLDLDLVAIPVHRGNEQSLSAVRRYVDAHGGQHEGLFRHYCLDGDGEPFDAERFSVTAEQYRDATGE
jgi:RimJ/RimL family protein N-acetyltransferase